MTSCWHGLRPDRDFSPSRATHLKAVAAPRALMNILYEEDGGFKFATIVSDQTTSLQVDTQHGKRSKVKAAAVFLPLRMTLVAPGLPEP